MLLYNWNMKSMTCCGECEIKKKKKKKRVSSMLLYNWNLKPMTCCGECEIYNIILLSCSSRVVRFTEMCILITDLEVLFAG